MKMSSQSHNKNNLIYIHYTFFHILVSKLLNIQSEELTPRKYFNWME